MSKPDLNQRTYETIVADLQQQVSKLVGVPTVGPDDNLFDVGVESLMLVDIKDSIRDTMGVNLKFSDFFSYYTVSSLAAMIDQRLAEVPA